jgi:omega-amidase
MHVYAVQFDIAWENREVNFTKVRAMLRSAKPQAGSLVVLPEMFSTGFSMNCLTVLEDDGGPTMQFVRGMAREFNVTVLAGIALRRADGIGQNGAVAVNADGEILCRYFKIHPYSHGHEEKALLAGDQVITFKWNDGIVAPSICYDSRFPEIYRLAAKRGAQIFALLSNWGNERIVHWPTLVKARAIENQAYFIACNRMGNDPGVSYSGQSMIVDPRGNVLAEAGERECVIGAKIDLPALLSYRRDFPALRDMHDTYENC